jgi:trehalose 6-phosphate phosphatase
MSDTKRAGEEPPPALDPARDALFLDFDGTLVEIAPRPDAIVVPSELPGILARLCEAAEGAVAVVSGRMMPDLERYLEGFPGVLIGSHGAERRGAPQPPPPPGLLELQAEVRRIAEAEGLLPEIKSGGAALHFRQVPEREAMARGFAEALAAAFPAFVVQPAKMAFELKPKGAAKDRALAEVMRETPFAGRRPVYLGDDATDEPALSWVLADGGVAVKVGEGASVAPHRLDGPGEVLDWLVRALEEG